MIREKYGTTDIDIIFRTGDRRKENLQVSNFLFFYSCSFSIIKPNFGGRREIAMFSPDFIRCNLILNSHGNILLIEVWLVILPELRMLVTALHLHMNCTKRELPFCCRQSLWKRRRWQSVKVSTPFQGSSRERWQVSFRKVLCVPPCLSPA